VYLSIGLLIKPLPGVWPRLLAGVIIVIIVIITIRSGLTVPGTVTLSLGAGLASYQAVRARGLPQDRS
jgi:hypothetical protein